MNVPLLDLAAQLKTIEEPLKEAVLEVIDSTRYIMGPKVDALESEIAEYVGVPHAIGVSSGTDALLLALMALEVKPGDIVVTTPYSFFATAGVVARLNADIKLVDIDPTSFNIDPNKLEEFLTSCSDAEQSRIKAIVPVHLYGQCADMDPILALAKKYEIPVIEDGAQAIGSKYPSSAGVKQAGSMGDIGCFSFFPSKNLGGIGDGGMVVAKDAKVAEKLRLMRNHGAHPKYYHAMIGGNFRLDPIQAAVLSVKLPHLDSWHAQRQENAQLYNELLSSTPVETPQICYERSHHIYNQYVIRVPEKRDEFRKYLTENGIGNEVYYPVPFHLQECFQDLGYKQGDFPMSEDAASHTVALPVYPEITNEMQEYVAKTIGNFYS